MTADERRNYDLIYPSFKGKTASSQHARESHATQIAALRKSKQERAARWWTNRTVFDSAIFEAERSIRRLEQEINSLDSILAAEAAEEAQKKSWSTLILSPIFKKRKESDEVKAQKDIAKQERRIQKDMKERRLEVKRAELKVTKASMEKSKTEMDAANLRDDVMIQKLQNNIWTEQRRQQQEQWEKREREVMEARRRQQAADRLAKQQQQEEAREWQKIVDEFIRQKEEFRKQEELSNSTKSAERNGPQAGTAICRHDGWWPKVQGRTTCPKCYESWTYLLQCPGCAIRACPKCQAALRPRRPRNALRPDRRPSPEIRTPSPNFFDDDCWW